MVTLFTSRKASADRPITTDDLPVRLGVRSNGEYLWLPTARENELARAIAAQGTENARRVGMDRRAFLATSAGMLTALTTINELSGCKAYDDSTEACDLDGAREALGGGEFILDVQTHHIELDGDWRIKNKAMQLFYDVYLPPRRPDCENADASCFDFEYYVDLVFGQSDTTVAVLSGLPNIDCEDAAEGELCGNPINNEGLAATRDRVNEMAGSQRMLAHSMVIPNYDIDLALAKMEHDAKAYGIRAWKMYTPWGQMTAEQNAMVATLSDNELIALAATGQLKGKGWAMDDPDIGIPVLDKARDLGVKILCCHKGFPLPTFDPEFTSARDICELAPRYDDLQFVVYHSCFNAGATNPVERLNEGPYDGPDADPSMAQRGVNDLVHHFLRNELPRNGNVWAELGGVWATVMTDPVQAQHVIGKLLKYVGERRILWGTDSIWNGSPQPQIEAFRALTITPEFQEKYGYPPLTKEVKARILGLNAAELYGVDPVELRCTLRNDEMARLREVHRELRRYEPRRRDHVPQPRGRRDFFVKARNDGFRP